MFRQCFIILFVFVSANAGYYTNAAMQHGDEMPEYSRSATSFKHLPPGSAPVIMQALQKDLPHSYQLKKSNTAFSMSNPSQGMRIIFTSDGPRIEIAGHAWGMIMSGVGYEGSVKAVEKAYLENLAGRMVYKRDNVDEWYINSGWGIEQGFTVQKQPEGKKGKDLVVELELFGDLQPRLDNGTLLLADVSGKVHSSYSGLQVFDTEDKLLPAHFVLAGNTLQILIDDTGAHYPVSIDPWIQSAKLLPNDVIQGDAFGSSVSISGDTVVIGAPSANSVYVFVKPVGGWINLVQTAKLTASDAASGDYFGRSVSINGDTIVVGAYHDENGEKSGAAYVFEKQGVTWTNMTETAKLTASDGVAYDLFGNSVSVSGNTIVVGAVYEGENSSNTGAAYVFEKPGANWVSMTETAKLTASDSVSYDEFGNSVSISGNTIVIGAHSDDSSDNLGENSGSAYIFQRPIRGGWRNMSSNVKLTASEGAGGDEFGHSVSISGDVIVIGARGDDDNGSDSGSAYVFEKPGTGWSSMTQTAKLTASDGENRYLFGTSVAISGETIVVGIDLGIQVCLGGPCGIPPGSAYVFEKPGASWLDMTETAKLTASDGEANDGFGNSVSISGETIVIGAPQDSDQGAYSGSAYVFENVVSAPTSYSCISQSSLLLEECNILFDFYNKTNGSGWVDSTNWLTNTDPCTSWNGVTCEVSQYCTPTLPPVCTDRNRVTEIRLPSNSLVGETPDSIGYLQKLKFLNLRSNQLGESIPTSFGNLLSLTNLYLDNNNLYGSIPAEIGNLSNLAYLDLSDNQLSGTIPTQIGNLTNLLYLDLSNNKLSDSIPTEIGSLTGLNLLDLSQNQLSGALPLSLGNLTSPTLLIDLSNNQLTNTVPHSVAQMGADASFCNFTGNTLCIPNTLEYQTTGNPICGLALSDACVTAVCSDNIVTVPEGCDDGNTLNGDGCSASCTEELGWYCGGSPSTCGTTCGDYIVAGSEGCDDGNGTNGDGCSSTCTIETGWTCSGINSFCEVSCGDNIITAPEGCDDGNTDDGDGCSSTCTIETKWICTGEPSVCKKYFFWPMFIPAMTNKVQ